MSHEEMPNNEVSPEEVENMGEEMKEWIGQDNLVHRGTEKERMEYLEGLHENRN